MKKNVIALLLAVVMASGSIGAVPVMAAETTAQGSEQAQYEPVATAEEEAESENEAEDSAIVEDASVEGSSQVSEEVPVQ